MATAEVLVLIREAVGTAVFILLSSVVSVLATPPKKAWDWSLEERVAIRTDAAARQARMAAANVGRGTLQSDARASDAGIQRDHIDGSSHPELFLPSEIYTIYMRAAYAYDDEPAMQFRHDIAVRLAESGLPEEIVPALEAESAVFIQLQTYEEQLRARMGS
ncbi:MAG: hypothetical protein ACTHQM_22025, partial [Thermoanaerobaculia bacterium]